jgi:hypothetical protein
LYGSRTLPATAATMRFAVGTSGSSAARAVSAVSFVRSDACASCSAFVLPVPIRLPIVEASALRKSRSWPGCRFGRAIGYGCASAPTAAASSTSLGPGCSIAPRIAPERRVAAGRSMPAACAAYSVRRAGSVRCACAAVIASTSARAFSASPTLCAVRAAASSTAISCTGPSLLPPLAIMFLIDVVRLLEGAVRKVGISACPTGRSRD